MLVVVLRPRESGCLTSRLTGQNNCGTIGLSSLHRFARRSASRSKALCLGVLPTLVDRLEAIAVGIENVRGIVARIVIQARAGLAVISRTSPNRCVVEAVHLRFALGDKADMCSPGVRIALS